MPAVVKRYGFVTIATILVAAVVLVIGYQLWWGSSRLPVVDRAPDFTLSDMYGKKVTLHDSDGKVRLVSFHYTSCPDICQATNVNLQRIQKRLKEEAILDKKALLMTITFDPKRDTEKVLQKYTEARNIQPEGWQFLRGTPNQTKQVLDGFKIVAEEEQNGIFMHSNKLFLVDGNENIRRIYNMGSQMNNDEIMKDISNLIHDSLS